jgi:hypothetical protein
VTFVYITTNTITQGGAAAIGLSAIFGFCILAGCCAMVLRRRRPASEILKQVTVVERRKSLAEDGKERRKSLAEDGKERRNSTLELRTVS